MTTADQILRNTQATLDIVFSAGDAEGDVTCEVTDADGNTVTTGAVYDETEAGHYTSVLPPQSALKMLTITWTGTWDGAEQSIVTYAEIVGGYLFTLAQARAYDKGALASETDYPDRLILEARAGITDFFQDVTGVSFIPRYGRATVDGVNAYDLRLATRQLSRLLSASVNGTALTADELAAVEVYSYGKLYRPTGWLSGSWAGRRTVALSYEHGYQEPPYEINQAALIYLRYLLVATDVGDRTISWSNELGSFRQAVPGTNYPTGIPTVDATLGRYTRARVGSMSLA